MSIVVLLIIMLAHLHHTVHLPFCEHWQNDFTKLFKWQLYNLVMDVAFAF